MTYMTLCFSREELPICPFSLVSKVSMADFLSPTSFCSTSSTKQTMSTRTTFSCQIHEVPNSMSSEAAEYGVLLYQCFLLFKFVSYHNNKIAKLKKKSNKIQIHRDKIKPKQFMASLLESSLEKLSFDLLEGEQCWRQLNL